MAEGLFPDHPRSGPWESLKGGMLTPPLQQPLVSGNTGDARFNGNAGSLGWASDTIVSTGMTRGGGTMAK